MGKKRRTVTLDYVDDMKAWKKLKEVFPKKLYDELYGALHARTGRNDSRNFVKLYPYEKTRYGCSYYNCTDITSPREIIQAINNNYVDDSEPFTLHISWDNLPTRRVDVLYILRSVIDFRFKAWVLRTLKSTLKKLTDEDSKTKLNEEIARIKRVAIRVERKIYSLSDSECTEKGDSTNA